RHPSKGPAHANRDRRHSPAPHHVRDGLRPPWRRRTPRAAPAPGARTRPRPAAGPAGRSGRGTLGPARARWRVCAQAGRTDPLPAGHRLGGRGYRGRDRARRGWRRRGRARLRPARAAHPDARLPRRVRGAGPAAGLAGAPVDVDGPGGGAARGRRGGLARRARRPARAGRRRAGGVRGQRRGRPPRAAAGAGDGPAHLRGRVRCRRAAARRTPRRRRSGRRTPSGLRARHRRVRRPRDAGPAHRRRRRRGADGRGDAATQPHRLAARRRGARAPTRRRPGRAVRDRLRPRADGRAARIRGRGPAAAARVAAVPAGAAAAGLRRRGQPPPGPRRGARDMSRSARAPNPVTADRRQSPPLPPPPPHMSRRAESPRDPSPALYRGFASRLDPFPADPPRQPPRSLYAFGRHCPRGAEPWLLLMAFTTAGIAIAELALYAYVGSLVDRLGSTTPATFLDAEGGRLLWMGVLVLLALPAMVLLNSLVQHQTLLGNFPMRIRWNVHRYLLRQSMGYFQDEFAGRIATKLMQTSLAVR